MKTARGIASTTRAEVPGHRPLTKTGRPFRRRQLRNPRLRRARDAEKHSSDVVWGLVDKMLAGDADAAIVLADVIAEGVSAGRTKFVKLSTESGYSRDRGEVSFAAITPGRQIVLFGVRIRHGFEKGRGSFDYKKAYLSRYKIGDVAEYSSYNLVYFGTITSISEKRVMIDKGHRSGKASLTIQGFATKNWDPENVEKGMKQNREWMD